VTSSLQLRRLRAIRLTTDAENALDLVRLGQWIEEDGDPDALIDVLRDETIANGLLVSMLIAQRATRWSVNLTMYVAQHETAFAAMRARTDGSIPLAEYVRQIAREYAGVSRPPRWQTDFRERIDCQERFLHVALTCPITRADNEVVLALHECPNFRLVQPERIAGVERMDLRRFAWLIDRDPHPEALARVLEIPMLDADADEARWLVAFRAERWNRRLIEAVWGHRDRLAVVAKRACALEALSDALDSLTSRFGAWSERPWAQSDVRMIETAAKAGILGAPLSEKSERHFPGLLLATAKTFSRGDRAAASTATLLLQAPILSTRVQLALIERDFLVHREWPDNHRATLAVDEVVALVSSRKITTGAAILIAENAIGQWVPQLHGSRCFSRDAAEALRVAVASCLQEESTKAARRGARAPHWHVLVALLERLSHRHDRKTKVLRRWMCLEPHLVLETLQERPAMRISDHRMKRLVMNAVNEVQPTSLVAMAAVVTAHPALCPSADFVMARALRWLDSESVTERGCGIHLLEWAHAHCAELAG